MRIWLLIIFLRLNCLAGFSPCNFLLLINRNICNLSFFYVRGKIRWLILEFYISVEFLIILTILWCIATRILAILQSCIRFIFLFVGQLTEFFQNICGPFLSWLLYNSLSRPLYKLLHNIFKLILFLLNFLLLNQLVSIALT